MNRRTFVQSAVSVAVATTLPSFSPLDNEPPLIVVPPTDLMFKGVPIDFTVKDNSVYFVHTKFFDGVRWAKQLSPDIWIDEFDV